MVPIGSKSTDMIKVIVADDHPIVVIGIAKMLENLNDIEVVATAKEVGELLNALDTHECDVLVCDFTFNGAGAQDGMRLMERLRQRFPRLRTIVLTMHEDPVLMQRVLSIGIAGFIGKSSSTLEALPIAIRAVHGGDIYLDSAISGMLVNRIMTRSTSSEPLRLQALTRREYEVVRQLIKGMTVSEIALDTHRSVKTISTQKIRAMEKLGARNDIELAERFRQLMDPEPEPDPQSP